MSVDVDIQYLPRILEDRVLLASASPQLKHPKMSQSRRDSRPDETVEQAARPKPDTTRRDDSQGFPGQVGGHENQCLAAIVNLFEERLGEC